MGIPVSASTGNPLGSVPSVLQFSTNFVPAQPTTQIQYQANLASNPTTANSSTTVPGSNLLNPIGFTANPLVGAPAAGKHHRHRGDPAAGREGGGNRQRRPGQRRHDAAGFARLHGRPAGHTITVNDGTNTTTYTYTAGDTVADLITAINAGPRQSRCVKPTVSPATSWCLTGGNFPVPITVGGTGADTAIGFGAGQNSFQPTNLLTQNTVAAGQTLTVHDRRRPAAR